MGEALRWLFRIIPHAHRWDTREAKRFCKRCGREEWLFSKPYPLIGEPKYFWKEMRFDRLKF